MSNYVDTVVEFINKKVNVKLHSTALILGSGFSSFLDFIEEKEELNFRDIPNFKVLGEDVKENKFVFGRIGSKDVILVLGRIHFNFGYDNSDIANLIFILKELGCDNLIISASLGSINPKIKVGDIVTCVDHINFSGRNPLYKCEYTKYGNLFADMLTPYNPQMIDRLTSVARSELGIKIKKGVLIEFNGPSVETVSESRFSKLIGADFTGFNVVNEVIASKYCSLPVIVVGLITNYGSYFAENGVKHADIVHNRSYASNYYLKLLKTYIENL